MFKILILQALNDLSDERAEFLITDSLSYMRLLGLGLGDKAPDRNTIWTFREALKKAGVIDDLFTAFDTQITASGYSRGPRTSSRCQLGERTEATTDPGREGLDQRGQEIWNTPKRAAQKDTNARWTIKYSRKKDGAP